MILNDLIGLVAGTLTTIAFIPQVLKIWRSKQANNVSTSMFMLFTTGVALWLAYGILADSLPVMLTNAVTLALAIIILFLKYRYRNNK